MELQPVQLCQIWVHWEISMFGSGRWTKLIAPVCVSHVVSGWVRTISSLLDCMHPSSNCVRTTGFFVHMILQVVSLFFCAVMLPTCLVNNYGNIHVTENIRKLMETYGINIDLRIVNNRDAPLQPLASLALQYIQSSDSVSTGIPHLLLLDHVHMVTWDIYHLESRWRNPQEVA